MIKTDDKVQFTEKYLKLLGKENRILTVISTFSIKREVIKKGNFVYNGEFLQLVSLSDGTVVNIDWLELKPQ